MDQWVRSIEMRDKCSADEFCTESFSKSVK